MEAQKSIPPLSLHDLLGKGLTTHIMLSLFFFLSFELPKQLCKMQTSVNKPEKKKSRTKICLPGAEERIESGL
jgi:hypothetical protein